MSSKHLARLSFLPLVVLLLSTGALPARAQVCAPVPSGLVSWWRAEGNPLDAVDGNNAALQNGATYVPGVVGQALSFDGVNDYAYINDSPGVRPTSLTIEGWFYFSSTAANRLLVSKPVGTGSANSYALWYGAGVINGIVGSASVTGPVVSFAFSPTVGAWYHLAYTFDDAANTQALYLNGVLKASNAVSASIGYDAHALLLGGESDNEVLGAFFPGRIDEASLYNRALSGAEVLSIYSADGAGKCFSPVGDRAPVVTAPASVTGWEASLLTFTIAAADPDGAPVAALTADLSGLPAGDASFTANGANSSGTFSWTPGLSDAGTYTVSFTASNTLSATVTTQIVIANHATLNPGDLYVADTGGAGVGKVYRIDPRSGAQTIVLSGGSLVEPMALAAGPNGDLYMTDYAAGAGTGSVFRLDLVSGSTSLVAPRNGPNYLVDPAGMSVGPDGALYIGDWNAMGGKGAIIRIDPTTGAQTPISFGGSFVDPGGVAVNSAGEIYVSDANGGAGGTGAIFRVDPVTGAQTLLTSGGNLVEPEQVTLDLSGDLIVAEYNSKIIRVNRLTGAQTMVSTGSYLVNAYGPFVTASGEILVADVNAYGGGGALIRIDPTSGVQRMVYWDGTLTDPVNVYAVPGAAATGGDIVVNSGLTINMAAGYNNVTVASGGKLVVDGTLNAAGNMTVQSGGSVSHTVRSLAGATLIVSGTMDVQTGGLIDLDALGLRGGNNGSAFGSTGETLSPTSETTIIAGAVGSNAGAGASFGGNGASGGTGSPSNSPYGYVEDPRQLGSGGGGAFGDLTLGAGHGGGRLTLTAGAMTLNGTIRANGTAGNTGPTSVRPGGGSGGSIRINVTGPFGGSGLVQANGGAAACGASCAGSGSGGRIAIYYGSMTLPTANISARGGNGGRFGAAGTIYLRAASQSRGDLLVDNFGVNHGWETPLRSALSPASFNKITARNGGVVDASVGGLVSGSYSTDHLRIEPSGTYQSRMDVSLPLGSELELAGGALNILNNSTMTLGTFSPTNVQSGSFYLSQGAQLVVTGGSVTVGSGVSFVKDGAFGLGDQIGSMVVQSGGVVTHSARYLPGLSLNVTGALDVQSGGLVNVSGQGLRGGRNGSAFGNTGEAFNASGAIIAGASSSGTAGAGASYGGLGATGTSGGVTNAIYGVAATPIYLGSGGAAGSDQPGGHGGGRITISANSLVVNGAIRANGNNGAGPSLGNSGGGGSGGTISILVNGPASGIGTIQAIGGNGACGGACSGSGSGGRIALVTCQSTIPPSNIVASGGTGGSAAQAGTVYTAPVTGTINASAGLHGSISPSGAVTVSCGSNQTFNFTPDAHYGVADVVVDGVSVGAAPSYTFTGVTTNHTISVTFAYVDGAPAVTAPATQGGAEGVLLSFTVSAADADGDAIASLTAAVLPAGATFTPDGTNTSGTFSWTPDYAQAGSYTVTFTAANALSGSAPTAITIANTDRAPVVTAPAAQAGVEGVLLSFTVSTADPDGDASASLTAAPLPAGATFTPDGTNATGTFDWTPDYAQAGSYTVTFTAANALSGSTATEITITGTDRAPVVTAPAEESGTEGVLLTFSVSAADADGDAVASFDASPLPAGAAFTPDGTNTSGTFSWTPDYTQAGSYTVTFTAANALSGSAATAITIANTDRAPVVTAPATQSGAEGAPLTFAVSASDADGDAIASLTAAPLPAGATFTPDGTNTSGTFSWTPDYTQAGGYTVTFMATNALSGSAATEITIANTDRAPVVTAPAAQSGAEGVLLTISVSAADPDADAVASFNASPLPAGASFTPDGTNTSGTFSWTPDHTQAGSYTVTFTAANALSGSAATEITIANTDRAPVVTAPAAQAGVEGVLLSFTVSAVDADGDAIASLTAAPLPAGANFTPDGTNTSGTFSWTPDYTQAGSYTVTFTAANALSGSAATEIAIANTDRAPVVTAPATQSGAEGALLTFAVSASDADGDAITSLTAAALPTGATFTPDGTNTTGVFSWTPDYAQAGSYTVTFTAANALSGSAATEITIANTDRGPVVMAPAAESGAEGALLTFSVSAADADGEAITSLTAAPLPTGATFTPDGTNTSGTFSWTPDYTQAGSYTVTFTAANALTGSAATTINIGESNRAPLVAAPPTIAGAENTPLAFTVGASDPDGDAIASLTAAPLPAGATFTPDGTNTSGTFSWTPDYTQAGSYTVTFTAANALSGSAATAITIANTDRAPVVSSPPSISGSTGVPVSFTAMATDPDGDAITSLTAAPLPAGATFTPNGSNTAGTFNWTPTSGQTGTYAVTITGSNALAGMATTTIAVSGGNHAPVVTITGPASGTVYAVGTAVTFSGAFTDDAGDTHTAQWTFDGTTRSGTINESAGTVTTSYAFASAGVYLISLKVTDNAGAYGTATTVGEFDAMIVVYDPNAGFVTGGGWITSPVGAYPANPTLLGKANFGFVSKYKKGATIPTGETEFQFKVASMNFNSTAYEWLVVSGAKAQYKGTGTINGAGNYGFMLTAIDGALNGGGGTDKLRMKIWDKANGGAVVYDNQMGATDGTNPTTVLGGGAVVIHTSGGAAAPWVAAVFDAPAYTLGQNYPNPFNPSTTIEFALPTEARVQLRIFDSQGRSITTLVDGDVMAGPHRISWAGRDARGRAVASGVYYYLLEGAGFTAKRQMLLLK